MTGKWNQHNNIIVLLQPRWLKENIPGKKTWMWGSPCSRFTRMRTSGIKSLISYLHCLSSCLIILWCLLCCSLSTWFLFVTWNASSFRSAVRLWCWDFSIVWIYKLRPAFTLLLVNLKLPLRKKTFSSSRLKLELFCCDVILSFFCLYFSLCCRFNFLKKQTRCRVTSKPLAPSGVETVALVLAVKLSTTKHTKP